MTGNLSQLLSVSNGDTSNILTCYCRIHADCWNGLEESLNEFGKKLQNEIDALKQSIAIQDQQTKHVSLKNDKL